MPTDGALDHLVLNSRFETDAARALLADLGFTLTPRGRHCLGSINHLAVFRNNYLEVIGLPTDGGTLRQEILDSPTGIDGLVLASTNAEASHASLARAGFALQPVQHFSRPVEIDGIRRVARFSTVRLLPGQIAAGRVYVCQHHTPDLVWRAEWTTHPNGVDDISGLVVVAADPRKTRNDLERAGSSGLIIQTLTRADFADRYGALSAFAPDRPDFFGTIRLHCADLENPRGRAEALQLPISRHKDSLAVALPHFQALLEFVA